MDHHSVSLKKHQITSLGLMSAKHSVSTHSIVFATFVRVLSLIHNTKNIATGYIPNYANNHLRGDVTQLSLLNSVSAVSLLLDKGVRWADLVLDCDSILNQAESNVAPENTSELYNKDTYFQTAFRVINDSKTSTSVSDFHKDYLEHFGTEFPLLMSCINGEGQQVIEVQLNYNAEFYDADRINAFGEYFLKALDYMIEDYSASCLDNNLVSVDEINKLIEVGSGEVIKLDEQSALQKICTSIQSHPDKILIQDQDRKMSGSEVAARIKDLACQLHLRSFNQKVVAVSLTRGTDWVCSLAAIMSKGAIYLPIDLTVPPSRVRTILTEANAEAIICSSDQALQLESIICDDPIELLVTPCHRGTDSEITVSAEWDDKAYVLFTSGSTGVP